MWRRRISTGARWACTLLSVVIVVVWVGSLWWRVSWMNGALTANPLIHIMNGAATVGWSDRADWGAAWRLRRPEFEFHVLMPKVRVNPVWRFGSQGFMGTRIVLIPLYLPFVVALAPAVFLWRREIRRQRTPACVCSGCGYDRAGLAPTSKCPECGRIPTTPSAL